jgi:sugar phosphate isomerase/epimerase
MAVNSEELRLDRRKFLMAAAGVAGTAALGSWAPWAQSRPGGPNAPIVFKQTLAAQHFSIRDSITRVDKAAMGYLGGPNFPEDPTDLGPLVPLPGGYQAVFQFLAECGYGGFEFYTYNQAAGNPGGANPSNAQIRQWLDSAGLKSVGTHTGGLGLLNAATGGLSTNGQTQLAIADALGHRMLGTAGDPVTGAAANTLTGWQAACDNYNKLGALLMENYGIKAYLHPEQNNWNFINDPAHPELARKHRIDFFIENTDPRYVFIEPDTFHMYNARGRFPDPVDGSLWDPVQYMTKNWKRLVGWHVKDAVRAATPVAAPGNPFEQTKIRPGFPIAGGVDVIYSLEGHIGNGAQAAAQPGTTPRAYGYDPGATAPSAQPGPDPKVWGLRRMFTDVKSNRAKGFMYHIVESDSGPGPATDLGRSLRHAKYSAKLLLGQK